MLLYDLLRHFPPQSLVAVTGADTVGRVGDHTLPFDQHPVLIAGNRWLTPRVERRATGVFVQMVRRRVRSVAKAYGVERIWAHYPNDTFIVGAWLAAKDLGLPLTVYFDILWEEGTDRWGLAREHEAEIVAYADQHFAITEAAAEFLSAKHGADFQLMPHTFQPDALTAPEASGGDGPPYTVHFAGGIYRTMNEDAVQRMAEVVDGAEGRYRLELYGPLKDSDLERWGVTNRHITTGFVSRDEIGAIQRGSDILYLPQAFEGAPEEMIRCNFPTKALEYMAAGKPILVHSPAESYLSRAAREHGFGVVVDEPSPEALQNAMDRLVTDSDLRAECVTRGHDFLRSRDSRTWSAIMQDALFTPHAT